MRISLLEIEKRRFCISVCFDGRLRDFQAVSSPLRDTLRDRPSDNLDIVGRESVKKIP
jgi:hypothetical protein